MNDFVQPLVALALIIFFFTTTLWFRRKWKDEEKRRIASAEHDKLYIAGLAKEGNEWKEKYKQCKKERDQLKVDVEAVKKNLDETRDLFRML